MKERNNFSTRAKACPAELRDGGTMEGDGFSALVKAAYREPAVGSEFERRVMVEVARRAIMLSRRRVRLGLVASLSTGAVAAAACVAAVIIWFPTQIILSIDMSGTLDSVLATIRALL